MCTILRTAGIVLFLEDRFCWDLQVASQALSFTWADTEILLVTLPPRIFIADLRLYVILLASDDTVGCGVCRRTHIPRRCHGLCWVAGGSTRPRHPGISSDPQSEQETLNSPVPGRKPETLPLLGGTVIFHPPNIACGFLTKPYLCPRPCNFVPFGARTRWF